MDKQPIFSEIQIRLKAQTICLSYQQMVATLSLTKEQWDRALDNPDATTNIFSFAEIENKYQIRNDSDIEKAFVVHLPHKKVQLNWSRNGLYYNIPTYNTLVVNIHHWLIIQSKVLMKTSYYTMINKLNGRSLQGQSIMQWELLQ
jgi:hypothetical protein